MIVSCKQWYFFHAFNEGLKEEKNFTLSTIVTDDINRFEPFITRYYFPSIPNHIWIIYDKREIIPCNKWFEPIDIIGHSCGHCELLHLL